MSHSAANTSNTHTKEYGYIGYCHLGKARVWSSSLTDCIYEAKAFIQDNPKYLTRKGIFVYKLGNEKKYVNKVT